MSVNASRGLEVAGVRRSTACPSQSGLRYQGARSGAGRGNTKKIVIGKSSRCTADTQCRPPKLLPTSTTAPGEPKVVVTGAHEHRCRRCRSEEYLAPHRIDPFRGPFRPKDSEKKLEPTKLRGIPPKGAGIPWSGSELSLDMTSTKASYLGEEMLRSGIPLAEFMATSY